MFHLYMKNLAFRIVSLNFPIQMQILDIIVIVHQSPTAWLNAIMPPTGRSRCAHAHLPVRMHNEYEERTLTHVHLCSTSKIEIIEIVRLFIVFFWCNSNLPMFSPKCFRFPKTRIQKTCQRSRPSGHDHAQTAAVNRDQKNNNAKNKERNHPDQNQFHHISRDVMCMLYKPVYLYIYHISYIIYHIYINK